jgi:signal transduction histidine kinase
VHTLSLFAVAALLAALAVYIWRARPESSINRWFGLFTLAISGWSFGIAGVETGAHTELFGRITFASASVIPASFLAFSRVFPTTSAWLPKSAIFAAMSSGLIFAILSVATPLVAFDISRTSSGIQRTPGHLYPAFSLYFLGCSVLALGVFIANWRKSRNLARAQLQYLGIGLLVFSAGATTTNLLIPLLTRRSAYSWFGPYFTLPLVALVAHSIIRHRLMDLRVVINRGLGYAAAITFVSALALGSGRLFLSTWKEQTFPSQADLWTIAFLALAMLSRPAQRVVDEIIDPYLFRGRVDHSIALRQATNRLSHLMEPVELSHQLKEVFADAFVPESFSMFLHTDDGTTEELLSDTAHSLKNLISTPRLTNLLQTQPIPTAIMVSAITTVDHETREACDTLRSLGVELIVSLGRRGHRLGTIFLGPRRSGDVYFTKDLALIESVVQFASIALENALLYRQRIQILEYSDRLLEALDAAVVAIDAEGRLTSFNKAAATLLNLAAQNRGQAFDVLPPEITWALAIAVRHPDSPREVEITIADRRRGKIPVIVSTAVLRNERQESTGALAVITDLSMVKTLERNQRRIERLDMMARFYAGIAHEIRSPLTAISNFVSMLPDRFGDPEYRETAARLLPLEVSRIVRLAERLRLMAPSEDGNLRRVSLEPLLSDLVAMHGPNASDRGITLSLVVGLDVPEILGDPGQLVQLVVNLINNAIEAMPTGGLVRIELSQERTGGSVSLRIVDEGLGIAPSLTHKVFQPFFTTKPTGTGLGLPICREIADFHHASLTLLSRADSHGIVAQVEFPATGPLTMQTASPESPFAAAPADSNRAIK